MKLKYGLLDAPLILFLDLQCSETKKSIEQQDLSHSGWIKNCEIILAAARERSWPIAHFRLSQLKYPFNTSKNKNNWIEAFQPRPSEQVYEHLMPSVYNNKYFEAYTNTANDPILVIVGKAGEWSCISTIIDAFHRGHNTIFVEDAIATDLTGKCSKACGHQLLTELARHYSDVVSTKDILRVLKKQNKGDDFAHG